MSPRESCANSIFLWSSWKAHRRREDVAATPNHLDDLRVTRIGLEFFAKPTDLRINARSRLAASGRAPIEKLIAVEHTLRFT